MHAIWKYLIQDFLEVSCRMDNEEAGIILHAYEKAQPVESHLEVHPAFSLGSHMTIVLKTQEVKEIWLYDPMKKRIEKIKLDPSAVYYR